MDYHQKNREIDMMAIGANIQKYRRIAGLTQEQLAERTERSPSNITKIENGTSQPSFELAIWIANELNVGLDRLYLDAVENKLYYYTSEIIRLLEPFPQRKKERALRIIKVLLEVMEEEDVICR